MKKIWQLNNFEIDLTTWKESSVINGKMVTINSFNWFCGVSLYIWLQNWYWIIVYILDLFHQNTIINPYKLLIFVFMTLVINVFYYPLIIFGQKITKTGYYATILSFTWLCAYHYTDINSCATVGLLIYTILIDFLISFNLLEIFKLVINDLIISKKIKYIPIIIAETVIVGLMGVLLYFIPSLLYTGY
jgi:hypothetical protein